MQEIILEFLFGPSGVQKMPIGPLAIAGIAQGVSSLIGAFSAGKQKRDARKAAAQYEADLSALEASRQQITNPYAGTTNAYANLENLTGMVSNPFQNLQVATQAAEMQATEADISLAGTLDTLRATGASAGGATALAQAALRSKQGVAATIEQQEAKNAQLRAQGQQRMEQLQMQSEMQRQLAMAGGEAERQKLIGIGEGQRMSMQEQRELLELDRAQNRVDQQRMIERQAKQAQDSAIGSLIGTAASFGAQALSSPKMAALSSQKQPAYAAAQAKSNAINTFDNMQATIPIQGFKPRVTGSVYVGQGTFGDPYGLGD